MDGSVYANAWWGGRCSDLGENPHRKDKVDLSIGYKMLSIKSHKEDV